MTKRILLAAVMVVLGIVVYFLVMGRTGESNAGITESPAVTASRAEGAGDTANTRARPGLVAGAGSQPLVPGTPSKAEHQVIAMYDEMTLGLKKNFNNCHEMARVIAKSMDTHAPGLAAMLKERASMTPEEIGLAQRRLEQQQGQTLRTLRDRMKQAIAKCKHNAEFMGALRGLAGLEPPQ